MSRWRALVLLGRFAFRADPARSIGVLVAVVIEMGSLGLFSLWLKFLADGVVSGDGALALGGAVGMTASIAAYHVANIFENLLQITLREKTSMEMDVRLMDLAGQVPTIEHYERADYARELEILRQRRAVLGEGLPAIAHNLGVVVQGAVTVTLLGSVHPLLMLLPLAAVPSFVISSRVQRMHEATADRNAESYRTAGHLFWAATERSGAMEIRVFGLGGELRRRYRHARQRATRAQDRTNVITTSLSAAGWLVFGFAYVAAIVFAVRLAVLGSATAGDVLLAVSLAGQVSGQVSGVSGTVGWLQRALRVGERYIWLSDHAERVEPRVAPTAPAPDRLLDGIRFEGVSFTYPGTEEPVLTDVDLALPAGRAIAVVGDNGAGKTTLVKLLLRFYEPTRGRITVDGTELSAMDPREWRQVASAGFQDFSRFEILARENVGVGELSLIEDEAAVRSALARASAEDVLSSLPDGLETQLGRRFDDGQELSTGQWQKLALGRAMMRDRPLLLVLDEPTASLDPMTEHALFERYTDASRRTGEAVGSITILVSHRFSTVRMADLIVVVDGGRVAGYGSHAELMAQDGLYAELYAIQADAYR